MDSTVIKGRTVLVTGAGNGIGRAIALDLVARGADVIAVARSADNLAEVAAAAPAGGSIQTHLCDVSDPTSIDRLRHELDSVEVDALVNNAGIAGPVKSLIDIEPDEWDETFDVNVKGIYLVCRAFLPPMIARRRGDVVNVASASGKRPLPQRTAYCASKMAVIGLTTTLAWEVGPYGIHVNSISPGPVDGPRIRRVIAGAAQRTGQSYEEAEAASVSRTALGRMLTEEEVSTAVAAMLDMTGMTGADIDLSAGIVAR